MFNIADYLKKFAKIEGDSQALKDTVAKAIKEACGADTVRFETKKGVVYIHASPIIKSAIYTKKDSILKAVRTMLPSAHIYDIR